jgi:hypothetical protein
VGRGGASDAAGTDEAAGAIGRSVGLTGSGDGVASSDAGLGLPAVVLDGAAVSSGAGGDTSVPKARTAIIAAAASTMNPRTRARGITLSSGTGAKDETRPAGVAGGPRANREVDG